MTASALVRTASASSLMTPTTPARWEVIEVLTEMNLREQALVMVGGGPVTRDWGDETGADGYGKSAIQAVDTAKRLMLLKRIESDFL